jgi:hypothetical protein
LQELPLVALHHQKKIDCLNSKLSLLSGANNNQINIQSWLNMKNNLELKQILINEITRHSKAFLQFFESKGHRFLSTYSS